MKFFHYILISSLISFSALTAVNRFIPSYEMNANIVVNNTVLAKVADKVITTYDVMKKLEVNFNRSFPDLLDSKPARFQFYMSGWQQTLEDLINNQLILMEAEKKELKITDGEIHEEFQARYGPNIMINLDNLGLNYEDALQLTKEEMIVQRMMYYFIKAKADQKITPSAIRKAYKIYCKENPPKETWSYYVVSVKSDDDKMSQEIAEKTLSLFKDKNTDPTDLHDAIKELEKSYLNCQISISNLYKVTNKEIAASQQKILNNLQKNSYSDIICQTSRSSNKKINRIFYLKDYERKEIEAFEEISNKLKEKLIGMALMEEAQKYFAKLKEEYHVDKNLSIPKDFVPFSIQQ